MVRFTFWKDHLDIYRKNELKAKERKRERKNEWIRRNHYNSTNRKL